MHIIKDAKVNINFNIGRIKEGILHLYTIILLGYFTKNSVFEN